MAQFAFTACTSLTEAEANGRVRFENGAFVQDGTLLLCVLAEFDV